MATAKKCDRCGKYYDHIDTTHGEDKAVLVVGRKSEGCDVKIINAFQGEEAISLYEKLTTIKGVKNDDKT